MPEPLVPVGVTTPDENRELRDALDRYRQAVRLAGSRDAVEPLVEFLAHRPRSAWRPVLLLNLGLIYRQTGHFSRALETWKEAWDATRSLKDSTGRALGDACVAHYSQYLAYLGRTEELEAVLATIKGRPLRGKAAELATASWQGLSRMRSTPEESFRCGPLALHRILLHQARGRKLSAGDVRIFQESRSTPRGLPLTAVRDLARKAGMKHQLAFRSAGAPVISPAVAPWSVGHYAAIVERAGDRVVVQDSTLGTDLRITPRTLDEQASGYFLVPAGKLPAGWRAASDREGARIWGRGDTGDNKDGGASGPDDTDDCTKQSGGMTVSVDGKRPDRGRSSDMEPGLSTPMRKPSNGWPR